MKLEQGSRSQELLGMPVHLSMAQRRILSEAGARRSERAAAELVELVPSVVLEQAQLRCSQAPVHVW